MNHRIIYVGEQIAAFKKEIKTWSTWHTGKNILNYIDSRQGFEYGKLIGRRDLLNELKEEKEQ